MPLRATARACGISLDTLFHLQHRIMELLQGEQAELLQGIVELDETFFRESIKRLKMPPLPACIPKKRRGEKKGTGLYVVEGNRVLPRWANCP